MSTVATLLALVLAAEAPWEGEAFSAEPRAMAAAAARLVPAGDAQVDILVEEVHLSLDAEGRNTETRRLVYVPRTAPAVKGVGVARVDFGPWFQDRPRIRARVVSRAGEARWLDPATLSEGPLGEESEGVFSDRRVLQGPLPGVEPGAVVELVTVLADREPRFPAGDAWTYPALRPAAVRRAILTVDAPRSLPLRHRAVGLEEPREAVEGERRVLRWEAANLLPAPDPEPYLPPDRAAFRQIAISTGRSWQEVARGYGAFVGRQLANQDLASTARGVMSRRDSPERAAQKVLDWMAGRIRYTGLAFGESEIVPARPSETLARRFGDCKDLALLAVGLLRAAGHPASVALVRVSPADVAPDLPGLGQFNHAIVRVGGSPPVWFDPTIPAAPAGSLPSWLQGRLALVVDDATTALERTPDPVAADNRVTKTRRIVLAEEGWASASETSEVLGVASVDLGQILTWVEPGERERQARERLNAPDEARVTYRATRGADRRSPGRLVMDASQSRWGWTGDDEAEAVVGPHMVFQRLPDAFRTEPLGEGVKDEAPPPRREAMWLPEAHRAELRYEVIPPLGFQPAPLPKGERARLGPAEFESAFAAGPDGMVRVSYRFEIPRRRLEPGEVDALWREVAARTREDGPRVRFQRTSALLLAGGKGKEAIAELRRLVALHPREARHHNHLAVALVQLGLVDAARAEARRALEIDPGSEWTNRVVAHTLEHDAVGRLFAPGFDFEGALAALRRARDLAPRSALARLEMARLLEHGPGGDRYGATSRMKEALAERRFVREELGERSADGDYAVALVHAGRKDDALSVARGAPPGPERNATLLAAACLAEGPEGMQREALGLPFPDRAKAATDAVRLLMLSGNYAAVADLVRRAAGAGRMSGEQKAAAEVFERIRSMAGHTVDPADPAQMPLRLMQGLVSPDPSRLIALMAAHRREQVPPDWRGQMLGVVRAGAGLDVTSTLLVDLSMAFWEVAVEGDGPWRVRMSSPAGAPPFVLNLFVVREGGEARIAWISPETEGPNAGAVGLGPEVRRLALAGDLAGARRILGWARQSLGNRARTPGAVLSALWTNGEAAGKEEILLGAAGVSAFGDAAAEALPVLEAAWRKPSAGARPALALARARAAAGAGEHQRALEAADALLVEDPDAVAEVWEIRQGALERLGRWTEARAHAEARLRKDPSDIVALRAMARVAEGRGDLADSERRWRLATESGGATAEDWNNAAWRGLFHTPVSPEALSGARKATELPGGMAYPALHTLAAALAASGEPASSIRTLRDAFDRGGRAASDPDYVVIGRVAQEYGLIEHAETAYRRAAGSGETGPVSSAALARNWLGAMSRGRR